MVNYTKKAFRGTVIMFVFFIASALLAYGFRLLLARKLSLEDFGLFFSLIAFFGFLSLFRDFGLSQSIYYFLPRFLANDEKGKVRSMISKILRFEIVSSFILAVIIILFSELLVKHYFHAGSQKLIFLFSIGFFLNSIELVYQTVFNGFQNQFLYSLHNFTRNVLVFSITLIGFTFVTNTYVPSIAYLITYALALIIFGLVFHLYLFPEYFKLKKEKTELKPLLIFGFSATLSSLGFFLITYTDTLLLTYFRTLEEVALYSAAIPIITLMLYLPFSVSGVILPLSSELWEKKMEGSLRFAVEKLTKYLFVILIPIAGVLIVYPEITLNLLFGTKFAQASPALTILAIGAVFYGVGYIYLNFLFGISGPKTNTILSLSIAILNLILNLVLIPKYGIIGAAISTAISYFVLFILSTIFLSKLIKPTFEYLNYFLTFISGGLFVVVIYYFKKMINLNPILEAIIVVSIAALIYLGLIFLLRLITLKELSEIKQKIFQK